MMSKRDRYFRGHNGLRLALVVCDDLLKGKGAHPKKCMGSVLIPVNGLANRFVEVQAGTPVQEVVSLVDGDVEKRRLVRRR